MPQPFAMSFAFQPTHRTLPLGARLASFRHPVLLLRNFQLILPMLLNDQSCLEVLHLILDLPCVTGALVMLTGASRSTALVDLSASASKTGWSLFLSMPFEQG